MTKLKATPDAVTSAAPSSGAVAVLSDDHPHAPDPQVDVQPWFDQKAQDLALQADAKRKAQPDMTKATEAD